VDSSADKQDPSIDHDGFPAAVGRPPHDCGEIFRMFGQEYERTHDMTAKQRQVLRAVASCRTTALGGHRTKCGSCGHEETSYNSCRDRHCPKCQGILARKWVEERKAELLPVPYFHLVFTTPDDLVDYLRMDARKFLNILFEAMSESLLKMFLEKHASIPLVTSILHTWGSSMILHPHLPGVVSGGGLSSDGVRWISTGGEYLLDVKELSKRFRDVFVRLLRKRFPKHPPQKSVIEKDWVVFCKKPFAGAEKFVEYIGRYTHRAAISNSRITDVAPERKTVTITYKDYKNARPDGVPEIKTMTLSAMEFIGRFLSHVLPEGFRKIRFHGLAAGKKRAANLALCRSIFGLPSLQEDEHETQEPKPCPVCGGKMILMDMHPPSGPPPIIFRNETWRLTA